MTKLNVMKKSTIPSFLIALVCLFFALNQAVAQNTSLQQGLRSFELKDYSQAAKWLEEYLGNNPSADIKPKLALSYKFSDQIQKARRLFEEILAVEPKDKEMYFEYADLLRSLAEFDKAKAYYLQYAKYNPIVGNYFADQCDYALAQLRKPSNCDLKNLEGNTEKAEFGPIVVGEEVVVVSQIGQKSGLDIKDVKSPILKPIVQAELSQLAEILENEAVGRGNTSIAAKAGMVAFSRAADMSVTQLIQNKTALSTYIADIDATGNWINQRIFPYCSDQYSVGFPHLMEDGNTMYFASNMPGGFGGFDLYVSHRDASNQWSTPQNLGAVINTPGNEISPFVAKDKLFFSSDWHPGFGGFDVFATHMSGIGWTSIENLGSCVNSTRDEYHFILDNQGIAYFTSNRSGGKGGEDIYKSTKLSLPRPRNAQGIVDGHIEAKSPFTKDPILSQSLQQKVAVYEDSDLAASSEVRDKIYFIQITALTQYNDQLVDRFKKYAKYGDVWKVEADNITKIRVGYFKTIGEASRVLAMMKKNGMQDAFIVSDVMDEKRMFLIIRASSDFDTPITYDSDEGKYKIRVAELKSPDWFDYSKISDLGSIEHWTKSGWTVIILGSYKSESTAREVLAKLKERGYADAYICIENEGKLYRL